MSGFNGIDLCLFAAATPPKGITSNFINPPTYAPVVIAVSSVMMGLATLFTVGRLIANWKNLTWSDRKSPIKALASVAFYLGQAVGCLYLHMFLDFNSLALIFSVAEGGVMLSSKYT